MGGGMAAFHAEETQAAETEAVRADIYPKPQTETYLSDDGMSLTAEVNIVLHGEQEEATLPKLQEMLTENGYTYSVGEYDDTKSNIILSSSKDHFVQSARGGERCSGTWRGICSYIYGQRECQRRCYDYWKRTLTELIMAL